MPHIVSRAKHDVIRQFKLLKE